MADNISMVRLYVMSCQKIKTEEQLITHIKSWTPVFALNYDRPSSTSRKNRARLIAGDFDAKELFQIFLTARAGGSYNQDTPYGMLAHEIALPAIFLDVTLFACQFGLAWDSVFMHMQKRASVAKTTLQPKPEKNNG